MTGTITTGSFPRLLLAKSVKNVFDTTHKAWDSFYDKIYEMDSSDKAYEVAVQNQSFGLAKRKGEADDIVMDSIRQAYAPKYVHNAYGLGFTVTREAMDDNQYGLFKSGAKMLARSFSETKEVVGHVLLNTAFSSTSAMTGGDGVALCSTSHLNPNGTTYSNRMAVDADFSEASLEDLLKQIMRSTDDRGKAHMLKAVKLIGHTDQQFEFERVLMSANRVGTANNDINAVKSMRSVAQGFIVTPYLSTNKRAWFLKTDFDNGLKGYNRTPLEFDEDKSFLNKNMRFSGYERYSFGYDSPLGIFGSNGA